MCEWMISVPGESVETKGAGLGGEEERRNFTDEMQPKDRKGK